jgi:hypothetical protein
MDRMDQKQDDKSSIGKTGLTFIIHSDIILNNNKEIEKI